MVESGFKGIPNENLPCGVGFVIIPEGVDPDTYKLDCYRTGRISIFGGYGHSNFYNILIDSEVLQEIVFPEQIGKMGSPVVWINIPKHNEALVIASIKYDQDVNNFSEFTKKITRKYQENIVNLEMNAKEGRFNISLNSNTKSAKMEVIVNSYDNKAELILKIAGKTIIHSNDKIIAISGTSVETVVTDKKGTVLAKTKLSSEDSTRFLYEDEFKNSLKIDDKSWIIKADKSKKIDFGNGNQRAVLGDILVNLLEQYDEAFSNMRVNTAFGPSSTRINNSSFLQIKEKFKTILSKLVNLD